jgi:ABC-2 type transport system ATP-binding protein
VLMLDRGVLTQQAIGNITSEPLQQITLQLAPQTTGDVLSILQNITEVVAVKQSNKHGYILSYNAAKSPKFDLQLLESLHQNKLQYRQLSKGLSLEEQLFSEN